MARRSVSTPVETARLRALTTPITKNIWRAEGGKKNDKEKEIEKIQIEAIELELQRPLGALKKEWREGQGRKEKGMAMREKRV